MYALNKVSAQPPFGNRDGHIIVSGVWSGDYSAGTLDFTGLALPNFDPDDVVGPSVTTAADGKDARVVMASSPALDNMGVVRLYTTGTSTESSSTVATSAALRFEWIRKASLRGSW